MFPLPLFLSFLPLFGADPDVLPSCSGKPSGPLSLAVSAPCRGLVTPQLRLAVSAVTNSSPVLSAPNNRKRRERRAKTKRKKRPTPRPKYTCQLVVSWPSRPGFFGHPDSLDFPSTNSGRVKLLRDFAQTWAEPFKGLVMGLRGATEVKALDLYDCVPPEGLKSDGRVVLMGDALHQMTMCKLSQVSFVTQTKTVYPLFPYRSSLPWSDLVLGATLL